MNYRQRPPRFCGQGFCIPNPCLNATTFYLCRGTIMQSFTHNETILNFSALLYCLQAWPRWDCIPHIPLTLSQWTYTFNISVFSAAVADLKAFFSFSLTQLITPHPSKEKCICVHLHVRRSSSPEGTPLTEHTFFFPIYEVQLQGGRGS